MSPHLPIVTMYMARGAERALNRMNRQTYQILSEAYGGHIGIMESVVLEVAKHVASRLDELDDDDDIMWPGNFDYEVSDPLGVEIVRLLVNNGNMNTMTLLSDHMIKKFFSQ